MQLSAFITAGFPPTLDVSLSLSLSHLPACLSLPPCLCPYQFLPACVSLPSPSLSPHALSPLTLSLPSLSLSLTLSLPNKTSVCYRKTVSSCSLQPIACSKRFTGTDSSLCAVFAGAEQKNGWLLAMCAK